jgi:cell division transport system ATP-binding protein
MIHFSHVYKTYAGGVHALSNIELEIHKGEFLFLTGPSGSGKTTLFKMISAFDHATSGKLFVEGYDLSRINQKEVPYLRRKIGVVFQDFRLLKERNIFENVALPLMIRNERASYIQKRTEEVLDQVGLIYKAKNFPEQLSGGEQQRVAIARAIIHQPGVLIADEPTGNLDPELSEEIMDLLVKVNSQGTTVFVASHDHDMVRKRARRVVAIQSGKIISDV